MVQEMLEILRRRGCYDKRPVKDKENEEKTIRKVKMSKETFVGLEAAYKQKVEKVHHPQRYYEAQLRKERKAKGLCVECGRSKITKSQKKRGLSRCPKCRKNRL